MDFFDFGPHMAEIVDTGKALFGIANAGDVLYMYTGFAAAVLVVGFMVSKIREPRLGD